MNDLVTFKHGDFVAREAFWEDARTVRFTRAQVGQLFRGVGGAAPPTDGDQNVVQTLAKRHPELQDLGVTLPVRATDGKIYETILYTPKEINTLAAYSHLPGARRYILKFPDLYAAEVLGRFVRVAPKEMRERAVIERVDGILALTGPEKSAARREFRETFGKSRSTVRRYEIKREGGIIPPLRKGRSDKGKFRKFPEPLRAKVLTRLRDNPDISTMDLWRLVENQASYSTVCRWRASFGGASFDYAQGRQIEAKEIAA